MRYHILCLIIIWALVIPVAFFEGKITPGIQYYTACFVEAFVFSIGVFVGRFEKR